MFETFSIITFLFAFKDVIVKNKNKIFIPLIILFFLIIFDGLRWEMGTDWQNYMDNFNAIDNNFSSGFEIGFEYYTYLIKIITDNYSIYLFITTLLIYIGIFLPFLNLTKFNLISFFLLLSSICWYSSSLRQMMACIFLSFSFTYIFNRKLLYFTIIITIGSFFHSSLLFMFPFYFLYGISNKSLFFIIISIFLLSYLIGPLLKTLESIIQIIQPGKDLMSRLDDKLDTNKILGYGRKIYTILGFYFFYSINKTNKTDKKITFFLHVSYFSFILYYLGVNYISILASRLDIYIAIISTSILAGLIGNSLPTKKHKIIFFFFITSLVIIYYLRLEFMDLFHPYSSIFYNYNYNRKLY